jgi:23S rRNA pseudouridine1911/1915/1917 synthase
MEIIYEDDDVRVIDKPAGVDAENIPGRAHRLDKDTSGVLIIGKNPQSLDFLQKQFQERKAEKTYTALVTGNIKNKEGKIEVLLGRSPQDRRRQKAFLPHEPGAGDKRDSLTKYRVIESFKDYDLVEAEPKTGRKHQIRVHMAYLGHPIAGDKLYGFKNQPVPEGLERQFLHASLLKIKLPSGEIKEFKSPLPKDLKTCLQKLKIS